MVKPKTVSKKVSADIERTDTASETNDTKNDTNRRLQDTVHSSDLKRKLNLDRRSRSRHFSYHFHSRAKAFLVSLDCSFVLDIATNTFLVTLAFIEEVLGTHRHWCSGPRYKSDQPDTAFKHMLDVQYID